MAQTRRVGKHNERAYLLSVPRPPSQATARPNREDVHISECGRDEAFRVVGFSPDRSGQDHANRSLRPFPVSPRLLKLTRMGRRRTAYRKRRKEELTATFVRAAGIRCTARRSVRSSTFPQMVPGENSLRKKRPPEE